MSVLETTLVFVFIPLAVAAILALLTLGAGGSRTARYRPGMPFEFTPVWFLAAPPVSGSLLNGSGPALERAPARLELPPGSAHDEVVGVANSGPKGGARGTW
jgi:hypothetical protein